MDICVACPSNYVTGGVELLHQLVAELNTYENINAWIWYRTNIFNPQPQEYDVYGNKYVTEPIENSVLIFPEIWANRVYRYKGHKKIIYWESVDNYFLYANTQNIQITFPDNTIHLAQSVYAFNFLLEVVKASKDKVLFITDYINDSFMNFRYDKKRKPIILYNPKKGMEFTDILIKEASDLQFRPIVNMTSSEVKELMASSMLYIDFGDHPGKDRIPREAAMCGCCVITGKNGSAANPIDVNIPQWYKFDRENTNVPIILDRIRYILDNYEKCYNDFRIYRQCIVEEKIEFKYGVSKLVKLLLDIK